MLDIQWKLLFDQPKTFSEIAADIGFSREYVRQHHSRIYGSDGQQRTSAIFALRKWARLYRKLESAVGRDFLSRIDANGLSIRPLDGGANMCKFYIGTHKCKLSNTKGVHTSGERIYWKLRRPLPVDFCITRTPAGFFVIPYHLMTEMAYIPTRPNLPVYMDHAAKVDWWKYYEKWDQLG